MKFQKKCQFLEMVEHVIQRDNSKYYGVSLRVPGEGIFTVNVMGTGSDVLSVFGSCEFGQALLVTFELRPYEKGFKLRVESVSLSK